MISEPSLLLIYHWVHLHHYTLQNSCVSVIWLVTVTLPEAAGRGLDAPVQTNT